MSVPTAKRAEITKADRSRVTRKVTLVGAIANLVLSIAKIIFGVLANSQSLLADGVHSLSDLLSDGLVYLAAHHSHQEPDELHPYGHARFETAATLGLSLFLFLVSAGLIWDATSRLFSPETLLQPGYMAIYVAVLSIVSKEWLYQYTRSAAKRVRSDMMLANAWHHRSDAISSIVVLVGVVGTIAGLPYLDAVAAVVVGLMIAKIGWDLGWGSMEELVDTGLDPERIAAIRDTILSVGGVRDIHMLRTRRLGGAASADVHVLVEPRLSVSEGHMIGLIVEQRLKGNIEEIEDVTVHIDPEDDEKAPPCLGLPLRNEALSRLNGTWGKVIDVPDGSTITLHYLAGKIHVDVYLPMAARQQVADPESLREILQAALDGQQEFGKVRLFWSDAL